jgi:hypothetical protein
MTARKCHEEATKYDGILHYRRYILPLNQYMLDQQCLEISRLDKLSEDGNRLCLEEIVKVPIARSRTELKWSKNELAFGTR